MGIDLPGGQDISQIYNAGMESEAPKIEKAPVQQEGKMTIPSDDPNKLPTTHTVKQQTDGGKLTQLLTKMPPIIEKARPRRSSGPDQAVQARREAFEGLNRSLLNKERELSKYQPPPPKPEGEK